MGKGKEQLLRFWNNDVLRYIFFGVCTTLVNLVCFSVLRQTTALPLNAANTISVVVAILFAYAVNAKFVFVSKERGFFGKLHEFGRFVGARLFTMGIEVGGVWLLVEKAGIGEFWAKSVIIQIVVLVLNYIFSKFLVFTKKNADE
ncbi:MAG: GtrA family protein [Clostridiales bacterium]|nr:GtrA family protein [Clostridiales bacterium]